MFKAHGNLKKKSKIMSEVENMEMRNGPSNGLNAEEETIYCHFLLQYSKI
jgi:hypothetical protein